MHELRTSALRAPYERLTNLRSNGVPMNAVLKGAPKNNLTHTYDHRRNLVLRFGSDGGVPLKPPHLYPSLRVILAEKGTHY